MLSSLCMVTNMIIKIKMDQVISREWKKVRKFVLFFFFLYNNKSYIFGDLDYVKNRYFKDNDRIYILLDIN